MGIERVEEYFRSGVEVREDCRWVSRKSWTKKMTKRKSFVHRLTCMSWERAFQAAGPGRAKAPWQGPTGSVSRMLVSPETEEGGEEGSVGHEVRGVSGGTRSARAFQIQVRSLILL